MNDFSQEDRLSTEGNFPISEIEKLETPEQVAGLIKSLEDSQEELIFQKTIARIVEGIRKFENRDLAARFLNSPLNCQEVHGSSFIQEKDDVRALLTDYIAWTLKEGKNAAVINADMDGLGKINKLYGDDGGDAAIKVWLGQAISLFKTAAKGEESKEPIQHLFFLKKPGTRSDELKIVLTGDFNQAQIEELVKKFNTAEIPTELQRRGKRGKETFKVTGKAGLAFRQGDGVSEERWDLAEELDTQANNALFQAKKSAIEKLINEFKKRGEEASPEKILEEIVWFSSWRKFAENQALEIIFLYGKVLMQDQSQKKRTAYLERFPNEPAKTNKEYLEWSDLWDEEYNRKVEAFKEELRGKILEEES